MTTLQFLSALAKAETLGWYVPGNPGALTKAQRAAYTRDILYNHGRLSNA